MESENDTLDLRASLKNRTAEQLLSTLLKIQESTVCSICQDAMFAPFMTECGHMFCYNCLNEWLQKKSDKRTCPNCRKDVKQRPVQCLALRNVAQILANDVSEADPSRSESLEELRTDQQKQLKLHQDKMKLTFPEAFRTDPHFDRLLQDAEDDVERCPRCLWECQDGECINCGLVLSDYSFNAEHDGTGTERDAFATGGPSGRRGRSLINGHDEMEEISEDDEPDEDDIGFLDDRDTSDILAEGSHDGLSDIEVDPDMSRYSYESGSEGDDADVQVIHRRTVRHGTTVVVDVDAEEEDTEGDSDTSDSDEVTRRNRHLTRTPSSFGRTRTPLFSPASTRRSMTDLDINMDGSEDEDADSDGEAVAVRSRRRGPVAPIVLSDSD